MADYLLIETRDPFEFTTVNHFYRTALDLKKAGHNVTLFLVQNGVLPARRAAHDELAQLVEHGVSVLADEFSLKERAIAPSELFPGAKAASMDVIRDKVAAGVKAAWH
jgi:predicted peroxiredoxin